MCGRHFLIYIFCVCVFLYFFYLIGFIDCVAHDFECSSSIFYRVVGNIMCTLIFVTRVCE